MKFETIPRESHEPDEYPPAHTRLIVLIREEHQVVSIHAELLLRQLCAPSAVLFYLQELACLAPTPRIGEEHDGKATVWQLTDLSRVVHGRWTFYFTGLFH